LALPLAFAPGTDDETTTAYNLNDDYLAFDVNVTFGTLM